jgi:MFS family permease
MIYLISAFASPVFGYIVDKTGKNISWSLFSSILTTLAHALLAFTSWNPYIGISIIGLSFSIWSSSIWPIIAFVIPEHQLGTAFGMYVYGKI